MVVKNELKLKKCSDEGKPKLKDKGLLIDEKHQESLR